MEELLDFSASINPLGLSPAVRRAVVQAVEQIPHYPDAYATALTEALAACHQLLPDEVVPANGSTSLIHLLPTICEKDAAWSSARLSANTSGRSRGTAGRFNGICSQPATFSP